MDGSKTDKGETAMTTSPIDQLVLPSCPHCNGKLHHIHDGEERYVNCMNCGRIIKNSDFESHNQTDEPSSLQTEQEQDQAPHPDTHNPNAALEAIISQSKPRCPYCFSTGNQIIPGTQDGTRICDACDRTFNVRTKTVMEKSAAPAELWLNALQLYADPERLFDHQALQGEQHADWQVEEVHRLISEAHQSGRRTTTGIIAIPKLESPVTPRLALGSPLTLPEPREPIPTSAPETDHMTSPNSAAEPVHTIKPPAQKRNPRLQDRTGPEQEAHQRLSVLRWPNGVKCTKCKSNDITDAPPSASSELRCRKCGQVFSARSNTLAHRMSISNVELEAILDACSNRPPKKKLLKGNDFTTTVRTKMLKRLDEAIVLWNQRHGQQRKSLTPLEYMSVNMFWAIGEEPDMPAQLEATEVPENFQQPETQLPENAETQELVSAETQEHGNMETQESNTGATSKRETEAVIQADPGDDQSEETKQTEPATQQQESEAAEEQPSAETNESSDPSILQTLQEMQERMGKMEKMIRSLEESLVSSATVKCPVCTSTNTSPSEALEGFNACNDCQCHFPTSSTPATEPKAPQSYPNAPKLGPGGTPTGQPSLINITVHSHQ